LLIILLQIQINNKQKKEDVVKRNPFFIFQIDKFVLKDLGSSNHTLIVDNNKIIKKLADTSEPHPLKIGDIFQMGATRFKVLSLELSPNKNSHISLSQALSDPLSTSPSSDGMEDKQPEKKDDKAKPQTSEKKKMIGYNPSLHQLLIRKVVLVHFLFLQKKEIQ